MAPTATQEVVFVTNKPRLRTHTKSRGGCLICKSRKVKCPEERPECRACTRRGTTCVYPNTFKQSHHVKQQRSAHSSIANRDETLELVTIAQSSEGSSSALVASRSQAQESSIASPASQDTVVSRPLSLDLLDWIERDDRQVIHSVNYYNTVIVNVTTPNSSPFRRNQIPLEPWRHHTPKMLQYAWIALVRSMQARKADLDPYSLQDVCYYRGISLRELARAIPDVKHDEHGIILSAVMISTSAEMISGGPWISHLEAARNIINLNGGYQTCFRLWPNLQALCFNFMVFDVFSATFCNSKLIDRSCSTMHTEYVTVLEQDASELDSFASGRPCPRDMLKAVAKVNALRASLQPQDLTSNEDLNAVTKDLDDSIESFDPSAWAITASSLGKTLPQRMEDCLDDRDVMALASHAACYQFAALLYFLSSCKFPLCPRDRVRMHIASQNLAKHAQFLFEVASDDSEGPLHTQLWKMLAWCLRVGLYVRIGWGVGEKNTECLLKYLFRIGRVLASNYAFAEVTEFMQKVESQRAQQQDWTWDDGVNSRMVSIL